MRISTAIIALGINLAIGVFAAPLFTGELTRPRSQRSKDSHLHTASVKKINNYDFDEIDRRGETGRALQL